MDVLIPTFQRPAALAVTLAGLAAQTVPLRVVIADQSEIPAQRSPEVQAMISHLRHAGTTVDVHHRPHRLGVAEQRDFLLGQARAQQVVCLDDDIWLQPWSLELMAVQLQRLKCGFVGMAPIGLSYADDIRPQQWTTLETVNRATPEDVRKGSPAWSRYELHNAANPMHLAQRTGATPGSPVLYRVAWVGGCVMYDRQRLEDVGGFTFWRDLPSVHAGEDVVAQLRVQRAFGGLGVLPSGAIHLELPTTIEDRRYQAYDVLGMGSDSAHSLGGGVAGRRSVDDRHAGPETSAACASSALGPQRPPQ